MTSKTIAILAAGEFPRKEAVLRLLDEADMIVCCDSAADHLVASGREPSLIVGDLDSLSNDLRAQFSDRLRHFDGQDDNDLTKAFHVAMEFDPSVIHILGATGRREDHTLGNISLLAEYQKEAGCVLRGSDNGSLRGTRGCEIHEGAPGCEIDLVSDWGRFVAASGERTFASTPGQEISIFAFDPALRMRAAGLDYPLDVVVFDSLWKAFLNRASGSEFTLTPNRDTFYLVYFCGC